VITSSACDPLKSSDARLYTYSPSLLNS